MSPMAHWQNEHANTPGDRLLALELARQNAKWPLLILEVMTDEVALEEQFPGLLPPQPMR